MARVSKEEEARVGGAQWMLRLVEQKGLEAAKKELAWRAGNGLPLGVKNSDIMAFSDKVKTHCLMTVLALSAAVLRDEFDFGQTRVQRFVDRFNLKADCLCMDLVSWDEVLQTLEDEVKIDFKIPKACKEIHNNGKK